MLPIALLIELLAVLVAVLLIERLIQRKRSRRLIGIGAEYSMSYSPLDRFAISERLASSREWTIFASDLSVRDVLYASRSGLRCFVATAMCRPSLDQESTCLVVRILEKADHHDHFELKWTPIADASGDLAAYRELLVGWEEH